MKNAKKTTVKKYDYVIDMTGCTSVNDLVIEICFVKIQNDIKLSKSEMITLLSTIIDDAISTTIAYADTINKVQSTVKDLVKAIETTVEAKKAETAKSEATKTESTDNTEPVKKPNVFKRFWNWITRKNK